MTNKKSLLCLIPNILTLSRILGAFLLLYYRFTIYGISIYLYCGLSDVLDGLLARRFRLATAAGSRLDSAADLIFFICAAYLIFPQLTLSWQQSIWIISLFGLRISSLLIRWQRFKVLGWPHTIANKISGLALFIFPLIWLLYPLTLNTSLLMVLISYSAGEELLIAILSKNSALDVKSIFA
ncbi:hypothetical protein SDC9_102660 [bioreactor metagenome]|uniref:CDP-diacylglycerol--glycerol-3-phosphate 3-phosphatidyltransferase n=1 Tax=bioreactor metagenome TaxID=1076179 RepID=A0A645AYB3_9ZZZZ|nr:CDP-alcohol phosphatidyltransferase family protein [Erysipelotrichaceae bacterium]